MYRVSSTKTACPRAQLCAVKIFKIAVFSNPERKPMNTPPTLATIAVRARSLAARRALLWYKKQAPSRRIHVSSVSF